MVYLKENKIVSYIFYLVVAYIMISAIYVIESIYAYLCYINSLDMIDGIVSGAYTLFMRIVLSIIIGVCFAVKEKHTFNGSENYSIYRLLRNLIILFIFAILYIYICDKFTLYRLSDTVSSKLSYKINQDSVEYSLIHYTVGMLLFDSQLVLYLVIAFSSYNIKKFLQFRGIIRHKL